MSATGCMIRDLKMRDAGESSSPYSWMHRDRARPAQFVSVSPCLHRASRDLQPEPRIPNPQPLATQG